MRLPLLFVAWLVNRKKKEARGGIVGSWRSDEEEATCRKIASFQFCDPVIAGYVAGSL